MKVGRRAPKRPRSRRRRVGLQRDQQPTPPKRSLLPASRSRPGAPRKLMARQAKGQVIERRWPSGVTYALRFLAYGSRHYLTLGSAEEGWTRARAEQELQ